MSIQCLEMPYERLLTPAYVPGPSLEFHFVPYQELMSPVLCAEVSLCAPGACPFCYIESALFLMGCFSMGLVFCGGLHPICACRSGLNLARSYP